MKYLYTIGYANKKMDEFLNCLKKNKINCVIDVRSSPYSKTFPEFNKDNINKVLKDNFILYANFNEEFGARRSESYVYKSSFDINEKEVLQVSFDLVQKTDIFKSGYKRVLEGIKQNFNICFMCSEKKPEDCHRFIMVASYFKKREIDIINIIDEEHNQTYSETINILNNQKKTFINKVLSKHSEYSGMNIFGNQYESKFDIWFNDTFKNQDIDSEALKFGNIKIGFVKGDEDYD